MFKLLQKKKYIFENYEMSINVSSCYDWYLQNYNQITNIV